MRKNSYLSIFSGVFLFVYLAGCTMTEIEQGDAEFQSLIRKPGSSQPQVGDKDARIAALTDALRSERKQRQRMLKLLLEREKKIAVLTRALQVKNKNRKAANKKKGYYFYVIAIQTALKDAGAEVGLIDGRMGRRTRTAIKNFQKINSLPVTGSVDKETWKLLKLHL